MEKYKLPNTNCFTCWGGHVNVNAKPVSRLEACPMCLRVPYPIGAIKEASMDDKGQVVAIETPIKPGAKPFSSKVGNDKGKDSEEA